MQWGCSTRGKAVGEDFHDYADGAHASGQEIAFKSIRGDVFAHVLAVRPEVIAAERSVEFLSENAEQDIGAARLVDFEQSARLFERTNMVGAAVAQTTCHFNVPTDALLKTPDEIDEEYLGCIGSVVFAA